MESKTPINVFSKRVGNFNKGFEQLTLYMKNMEEWSCGNKEQIQQILHSAQKTLSHIFIMKQQDKFIDMALVCEVDDHWDVVFMCESAERANLITLIKKASGKKKLVFPEFKAS